MSKIEPATDADIKEWERLCDANNSGPDSEEPSDVLRLIARIRAAEELSEKRRKLLQ